MKPKKSGQPSDWKETTIARTVPSLQLAETEDYILTSYTYTFLAQSGIFMPTTFSASPAERLAGSPKY